MGVGAGAVGVVEGVVVKGLGVKNEVSRRFNIQDN